MTIFGNPLAVLFRIRYFEINNRQEELCMCKWVGNRIKKIRSKNWMITALNAMAVLVVIQNVNAGCFWVDHQPEVQEEARRFRKF